MTQKDQAWGYCTDCEQDVPIMADGRGSCGHGRIIRLDSAMVFALPEVQAMVEALRGLVATSIRVGERLNVCLDPTADTLLLNALLAMDGAITAARNALSNPKAFGPTSPSYVVGWMTAHGISAVGETGADGLLEQIRLYDRNGRPASFCIKDGVMQHAALFVSKRNVYTYVEGTGFTSQEDGSIIPINLEGGQITQKPDVE